MVVGGWMVVVGIKKHLQGHAPILQLCNVPCGSYCGKALSSVRGFGFADYKFITKPVSGTGSMEFEGDLETLSDKRILMKDTIGCSLGNARSNVEGVYFLK